MFRLELYALIARDRQREVLEQARLNALLRDRKAALKAAPVSPVLPPSPSAARRQPGRAEARAAEGNR